jgi:hypothetical protein
MHPLAGDLSLLKDAELESKIHDLTNKYFMAQGPDLKAQISNLLQTYNEELRIRRKAALDKLMKSRDKNLDKLINVR